MGDPLSIAASIIGIVGTGFTVAKGLYQIAEGIGSAGHEVRNYADEISVFSKLLERVRTELARPSGVSIEEQSLIKDIMDICDRVLLPLDRLQNTLKPLLENFRKSSKKLFQFGLRVKWIFTSKNKLLFYRELLKGQHRVLDTTLELMILRANRDRTPHNIFVLQVSLEHSMKAMSRSLENSNALILPWSNPTKLSTDKMITSSGESTIIQDSLDISGERLFQHDEPPFENDVLQTTLVIAPSATNEPTDKLSKDEIQEMEEQIERDLDPDSQASAREVWEDMRVVSRKVLRLASTVLRSSQEDEPMSTAVPRYSDSFITTDTSLPTTNGFHPTFETSGRRYNEKLPEDFPLYEYQPLPSNGRFIRLLELVSGTPENPYIDCEFMTVPILPDEATDLKYEILSWNSRPAGRPSYIRIRRHRTRYAKYISAELYAGLRTLRDPIEDRYFWIEDVCVDKSNPLERNGAVEMMRDIYRYADRVCVWLGEGSEDSTVALDFIKDELLKLPRSNALVDISDEIWRALTNLIQRPWFSRLWAISEIVSAEDVMVFCGWDSISWNDFATAVGMLMEVEKATRRLSEIIPGDTYPVPDLVKNLRSMTVSHLVEVTDELRRYSNSYHLDSRGYRKGYKKGFKVPSTTLFTLEYLVSRLTNFEVDTQHDSIYALLTIAKGTIATAPSKKPATIQKQFIHYDSYFVDYSSHYHDVCKNFIQFCIQRSEPSRALDIICRPWALGAQYYYLDATGYRYDDIMPMPSWIPQSFMVPITSSYVEGANISKVKDQNTDSLVGLPTPLQRHYQAAGTKPIDLGAIKFKKRLSSKHFSMYVTGFISDQLEVLLPTGDGDLFTPDWLDIGGWHNIESLPPDAFWRTLVANRDAEGRNPPAYYPHACREGFLRGGLLTGSVTHLIEHGTSSAVVQFWKRARAVIQNRCLIRTDGGKIGLASPGVLKGDLVCILYGCSVPVILRPKKKTMEEIREERTQDFITLVIEMQRRWRRRKERARLIEETTKKETTTPTSNDQPSEVGQGEGVQANTIWMDAIPTNNPTAANSSSKGMSPRSQLFAVAAWDAWENHFEQWLTSDIKPDDIVYYIFLGEAYVHGRMDGEALRHPNADRKQVFELR